MKKLEVYIIVHNKQSYDTFQKNNNPEIIKDFKYILVGGEPTFDGIDIHCYKLPMNIEIYKSLLTFTAWYAIAKNKSLLKTSEYVCLLEYDTIIQKDLFSNESILNENTIYGFIKRTLPDKMLFDCVPKLKSILKENTINKLQNTGYWLPTTNFIMPFDFLVKFVNWYEGFIGDIISMPAHSHYHERVICLFALNNQYLTQYLKNQLLHLQSNSHNFLLK